MMELSRYPLDTQTCAMMLSSCKYILLKLSCVMELSRYPLDTQTCAMMLSSCKYCISSSSSPA